MEIGRSVSFVEYFYCLVDHLVRTTRLETDIVARHQFYNGNEGLEALFKGMAYTSDITLERGNQFFRAHLAQLL